MDRKIKFGRLLALAVSIVTIFSLMTMSVAAFDLKGTPLPTLPGATTEEQLKCLEDQLLLSKSRLPIDYAHADLSHLDYSKVDFDETKKVLFLKKPIGSGEYTQTDLGTIYFRNVGKIENKSIDARITIKNITLMAIAPEHGISEADKVQFALFRDSLDSTGKKIFNAFWLSGFNQNSIDEFNIWHSSQTVEMVTDVVYSGTDEVVDYNFIHCISDLDTFGRESARMVDGYTGKHYYFDDHTWLYDEATRTFKSNPEISNFAGLLEYTLGGVFLQTESGEFTTEITTAHSGSTYQLFSQYLNDVDSTNPYKEIVPENKGTYKAGDTVTFDVALTMFKWFGTFERYSALSLSDELPDGLTYVSAKLLDGDEKDITATAGTLTPATADNENTVSYDFSTEWLNNDNNYNGKDVTLRIEAMVDGTVAGEIVNIGEAKVNGKALPTNEIIINVPTVPALSGRIWNDADKNGLQDADEASVSDIKVTLYDSADAVVGSMLTDENGGYKFSGLKADTYTVKAEIDFTEYELTAKNAGDDDTKDSDADKDGDTAVISEIVVTTENIENLDIGIIGVYHPSLSGRIWNDANKNGLQDADEASVSDIKVTLYDSADAVVGSMLTDENGGYKFSGLKADTYTVKADIDFTEYELTAKNAGDDTKDSDADKDGDTAVISEIVITDKDVEHMDIGIVEIPEETTPTLPPPPPETTVTTTTGGIVVTTIITGSTTPETTVTPVVTEETTPETTTPVIVTTEDVSDTTAIITSDDETTTAATTAEENPSTGNAPIAMASVAAALGAVMLLINKKKK